MAKPKQRGNASTGTGDRQAPNGVKVVSVSREAPLPPPAEFREYDQLIPNGADRIMAQWESETAHRHRLQRRQQLFPLIEQIVARVFALLFAAGCLAAFVYAVSLGHAVPASIIGGAMIIHGINAFLRVRK
jgi:uncharacterized membrane protein